MIDTDALRALLVRVEAATGPDRELDALLWCVEHDRDPVWRDGMLLARSRVAPFDEAYIGCEWGGGFKDVGRFSAPTASLDAAVALVTRLLPDVERSTGRSPDGMVQARIGFPKARGPHIAVHADRLDGHEALALVAALLRALISRAGDTP